MTYVGMTEVVVGIEGAVKERLIVAEMAIWRRVHYKKDRRSTDSHL